LIRQADANPADVLLTAVCTLANCNVGFAPPPAATSKAADAIATVRTITSQFCVAGHVKQSDIIRASGVTSISVKRSVKIYREKGPNGFYAPRVTRGPAVPDGGCGE
jgi:hypothetical protein